MFGKDFQRKYALSDQGVKNAKLGTIWTVIVNLVVMGGMGILYVMMRGFLATLTDGAPLPPFCCSRFSPTCSSTGRPMDSSTARSKRRGSRSPSACASCRWAISASAIWPI